MSMKLNSSQNNRGIRVLDPDLPLLAIEAGIDIDNILSERANELEAIHKLTERLKFSIEMSPSGNHLHSQNQLDPATITVLSEAMLVIKGDKSLQKVKDLISKASKIVAFLSSDDIKKDRDQLIQARDFCAALSRAAVAYRKSIFDMRPLHPSRR